MTVRPFRASIGRKVFRGSKKLSSEYGFAQAIRQQLDVIEDNYREWVGNIDDQAGNILYDALEPTLDLSAELCPVDTGELVDSRYLEVRKQRGRAQVEIGYARGGVPDYAVFVHENLDMNHEPPTQAKFLQVALEQDESNIQDRVKLGFEIASGFAGGR